AQTCCRQSEFLCESTPVLQLALWVWVAFRAWDVSVAQPVSQRGTATTAARGISRKERMVQ
ncbi:hypothetical protein, partial [Comamonas kerstersii]|uniref:hypothetical protein n=1 Tax=Comamonas kerstersii TaxID=225992 RepID=UPI0019636637